MNDDLQDRVAIPHFGERLWQELARAHGEQRAGSPGGPPDGRRKRPLLAIVGVAAAAAIVVAGSALSRSSGATYRADRGSPTEEPGPASEFADLVAAEVERVTAGSVVHEVRTYATGADEEIWTDLATGTTRRLQLGDGGRVDYDVSGPLGRAPSGEGVTMRTVDHCNREVSDSPWPGLDLEGETRWVAVGLREGWLVEDGTELVEGQELARLRIDTPTIPRGWPPPPSVPASAENIDGAVLVDPATHLPVRTVQFAGTPDQAVENYEYLPRTPENLGLLTTPVPEDYTTVDAPTPVDNGRESSCAR